MIEREEVSSDDPRLLQASRDYLAELEAGRAPSREAYFNRYPDLTEALQECFEGIDLAHSINPVAPHASGEEAVTTASPLGDFQIVRPIARGGMGIVYEAIQLSLGRRVALKVLPFAAALDQRQLQRFRIESHAAAQLHHTHIVPVYAVGCDRGVHYYAMQFIEGRSLAAVIEELRAARHAAASHDGPPAELGRVSPAETIGQARSTTSPGRKLHWRAVAQVAACIADALEFAHAAGVVHRDVKPANILLGANQQTWITDFGLAYVAADVSITRTGEVLGTLRYMSPEQARGERANVDHRTDIYSLGATLYEWLALQPIFSAEDRAALLYQILHEDPRPLRSLDRAIPVELETIVHKALAKSPEDRYAAAGAMADDLRRFIGERPILARRPTLIERARKWWRRHPAIVAAALICAMLGAVGLAVATALISREQALTKQALLNEQARAAEAEAHFALARQIADELIRVAEEDVSDDPFQEGLRTRLLETALQYYQEFIDDRQHQPRDQAMLRATRDRVQQILDDLAVLQADRQFYLLREPAVLDDLQATAEQRQRLQAALADFPGPLAVLGPPPEGGRGIDRRPQRSGPPRRMPREQLIEMARSHERQLAEILTGHQLERLNQIALQCQGLLAFFQPPIARQLELTRAQRDQLREMEFQAMAAQRQDRPGPPNRSRPRIDVDSFIDQVLTPEQIEQWSSLIGAPFPVEQLNRPPR